MRIPQEKAGGKVGIKNRTGPISRCQTATQHLLRCLPRMSSRSPSPSRVFTLFISSLFAAWLPGKIWAAPGDSRTIINHVQDDVGDVTDFFDTILPSTLMRRNLSLDFIPKFSDFRAEEFIRIPLQVRYDISDNDQLQIGMTPFIPNPFNNGYNHRFGPGEGDLGCRHDMDNGLWFLDQAIVGFDARVPIGKPPIDLNEGFTHLQPYITGSRRLRWAHTKFFMALSYDREVHTPGRNTPTDPRVLRQNITEFDPGILYKPSVYGYFFQYQFRHYGENDGYHLSHGEKLGVIWDVPIERSKAWKMPGRWQIELAARVIEEEGHPVSYGLVTQVRVRTTLHEVLSSDFAQKLKTVSLGR